MYPGPAGVMAEVFHVACPARIEMDTKCNFMHGVNFA